MDRSALDPQTDPADRNKAGKLLREVFRQEDLLVALHHSVSLCETFFARFCTKVQGAPRFIATATLDAVLSFHGTAHESRAWLRDPSARPRTGGADRAAKQYGELYARTWSRKRPRHGRGAKNNRQDTQSSRHLGAPHRCVSAGLTRRISARPTAPPARRWRGPRRHRALGVFGRGALPSWSGWCAPRQA
jgi:hypothetical protein